MHAGDLHAMSVIPGKATLVGTVRTFRPEVQDMVERRLNELCSAVALGLHKLQLAGKGVLTARILGKRSEHRFIR